jgi:hypothetical protein
MLWNGDFSYGIGQWLALQDSTTSSAVGNTKFDIVPSFRSGVTSAGRFTVNPSSNSASRAELLTDSHMTEGSEYWYGASLLVPSNPNKADGWGTAVHNTVMQFKNEGTGSPPVELGIWHWSDTRPDNGLEVRMGGTYRLLDSEAFLYDRTIDLAVHVKFSSDPSQGFVEVWVNGVQVVPPMYGRTLNPGVDSYLKQGLYTTGATTNVVEWAATARGTSRAAVDPSLRFG